MYCDFSCAFRVYQVSQKSKQQQEVIEVENIVLSDTVQQLTTGLGKEPQLELLRGVGLF